MPRCLALVLYTATFQSFDVSAPIVCSGPIGNDVCYGKAIAACGNGGRCDLAMEIFNRAEDHEGLPGAVSTTLAQRN